ncbi:retrovirus-related Pol polyprotein from transposon TNT 1-94 [Trichonephila clavipes]|nr:retrovirus-related Pol polyprotein from transposon TNT 1-94 [Trichonephila clavipes]
MVISFPQLMTDLIIRKLAVRGIPDQMVLIQKVKLEGHILLGPWIRKPVERKDRSRTDIYYFVEGSKVRLGLFNEVQKYCKDKNIDCDQNLFNFSGKNSSSGKVTDLLNLPLEEKANHAEVQIPKSYREATRTAEAAD